MGRPRKKPPAALDPVVVDEDAEVVYRQARERCDEIRDLWVQEGKPLLARGSTGQLVEHPLVKMLREGEAHAAKLREALAKRHRGPQPSAVPSVNASPAAQLRAVR